MARIHGSRGQILMDPTGGTTYVAVASMNEWTLDFKRDKVDVTAFGDTNKQVVLGLPDYSGTFGGFWDKTTSPSLFDVILGSVAAALKLVPDAVDVATTYFSGLAYLDGSINVSASGAVTVAGSFAAAGNWTATP